MPRVDAQHRYKGLKAKFGDHYDLATLNDKNIVDAVQDYKIAHVKTLFSRSPELHDSLKERLADEKASLERLADSDATLRANGVVVERHGTAAPVAASSHRAAHGHPPAHEGTLRLNDRSAAVGELQTQLEAQGYRGADGRPLHPDQHFSPNTRAALEAFQRNHHLQAVLCPPLQLALATMRTINNLGHVFKPRI